MSRCLASSGQHLVDGERSSGSSQWFQQDGATPTPQKNHWHGYSSCFPDRLISRRCDPQWSPYSPDLNPPDFYLWGYLKDRVYANNPQSIPDLKAAIRAIPREECGRVIENFARRIQVLPAAPRSSFRAHFLSASETKRFCSTDLKFSSCLLHRT